MRVWIVVLIVVACGACGGEPFEAPLFDAGGAGGGGGEWSTGTSSSAVSSSVSSSVGGSTSGTGGMPSGGGGYAGSMGTYLGGSGGGGGSGGTSYGPDHFLAGKVSDFFVTQLGCSPTGGAAGDAAWFCEHLYGDGCGPEPGWSAVQRAASTMVHSGTNCFSPDPGVDVPGTACVGGPCKIGDYADTFAGLAGLVCECPP